MKLHYNWKYVFLRPSMAQIIARYKVKFGGDAATATAPAAPTAPLMWALTLAPLSPARLVFLLCGQFCFSFFSVESV